MLAATLVALALFGRWPFEEYGQVRIETHRVGDWTIRIAHDTFTDRISCSLAEHGVRFQRDTLIFSLGRESDTGDAFFRIDGAPARSVREATLEDDRHGFYRNGGPVENPSDGEVALPAAYFTGARQIAIRISTQHAPRLFNVRRLDEAVSSARAAGCSENAL